VGTAAGAWLPRADPGQRHRPAADPRSGWVRSPAGRTVDLRGPGHPPQGAAGACDGMTGRLLIRDACLAAGYSSTLQMGVSLMIEDGQIAWVRPHEEVDAGAAEKPDAGGTTIVPAFSDGYSQL